jgi:hypothetical protein
VHDRHLGVVADSATAETLVLATTLGPFVTAFSAELGKRLGGSTAEWAARMRLRKHQETTADLVVSGPDEYPTTIELLEDFPDDARLALLDLDITNDEVRGHRIKWNRQRGTWVTDDPFITTFAISLSKRLVLQQRPVISRRAWGRRAVG